MGLLLPLKLDDLSTTSWVLILTATSLALFVFKRVLYLAHDPREPPLLWPKIPFIGHAISIVWEAGGYPERLL